MITKTHLNRLFEILAHGPWGSPAEFIFAAFTESLSVESPPPHSFEELTVDEYNIVMMYALSRNQKWKKYKNMKLLDEVIASKEVPDSLSIKSTDKAESKPVTSVTNEYYESIKKIQSIEDDCDFKKPQPIKGSYNSIWDRPSLNIEDSLVEEVDLHKYLSENNSPVNNTFKESDSFTIDFPKTSKPPTNRIPDKIETTTLKVEFPTSLEPGQFIVTKDAPNGTIIVTKDAPNERLHGLKKTKKSFYN